MVAFASAILTDVPAASAKLPSVERVTPNAGSTAGGTEVEITGGVLAPQGPCSFSILAPTCPELIVYFGSEPGFVFEAAKSKILAISPAHEAAPVQEAGAMPVVSAVVPNSGPNGGFNAVLIRGEHLLPDGTQACIQCSGVVVHFGSANVAVAEGVQNELLVYAPPHAVGTVTVTVTTNPGATSSTLGPSYTYTDPPAHRH
jgi:IPT/TIG domain